MKSDPQSVLILLAGALWNDSRVLKIAASLSERYNVTVWCYEGGNPFEVPYEVVAFPKKTSLKNKILARSYFWKPFHRNIEEAIHKVNDIDLIWANDLNTLYTGSFLSKKANARLIYDSHEIYVETINQFFPSDTLGLKKLWHKFNCKLMQKLGKSAEKKYGDHAAHIFTANDSFKEVLGKRYNWNNISSLYNMPTISSSGFTTSKSIRDGFSNSDVIVLYHGMFNAGRGLELVIIAFTYLPKEFKLVLLGKGFMLSELEELVHQNNLSDSVFFKSMVPEADLIEYIKGADVGINLLEKVNLSKWLASPNKLFQYIHAGIPVVCSKSPENIKVMKKHTVGALVENDAKSIAKGITAVFENKLIYSESNMTKIALNYSWGHYHDILMNKVGTILRDTSSKKVN